MRGVQGMIPRDRTEGGERQSGGNGGQPAQDSDAPAARASAGPHGAFLGVRWLRVVFRSTCLHRTGYTGAPADLTRYARPPPTPPTGISTVKASQST